MIKVESNKGNTKMEMEGTVAEVLADIVAIMRHSFANIAATVPERVAHNGFCLVLEELNEGGALDWDEIMKVKVVNK